ncbi:hypothetical protein [Acinetobacter sp. P8-3-8]|nr:hypothetical protein [Acinetobacter sp. P8-3-8]
MQHTSVVDGRNLSGPKVYTIAVPEGSARPYVSGVGGNTGVWSSGSVG